MIFLHEVQSSEFFHFPIGNIEEAISSLVLLINFL